MARGLRLAPALEPAARGGARHLRADGAGGAQRHLGPDQHAGQHQLRRGSARRLRTCHERPGELAVLRVPLSAVAPRPVRPVHRRGHAAAHRPQRRPARLRRVPRHAVALHRDDPADDGAVVRRPRGAGREHDRHRLPARPLHGERHAPDGARAQLLCRGPRRLRDREAGESGVLRAGRRAHADGGQHVVNRPQRGHILHDGEGAAPGTRGPGALPVSGLHRERARAADAAESAGGRRARP